MIDAIKASATRFASDTAGHVMAIEQYDGVFRHIRFRDPAHGFGAFQLTTWPGYLCISGDMGCHVFARLTDMFEFFRRDAGGINPQYWAEKLQSGKAEGVRVYDGDKVRSAALDGVDYWCLDDAESAKAKAALLDDLDGRGFSNEVEAKDWLTHYVCSETDNQFSDVWEWDVEDWHPRFLWCLHAIVWGIAQYDAAKPMKVEEAA